MKWVELSMIDQAGFSAIEPIVALALFAAVFSGIIATAFGAQNLVLASELRLQALSLAQTALENYQSNLGQNWFAPLPAMSQQSVFTITVSATDLDDFTKQISSKVEWQNNTKAESVTLNSLVSDWKNAKDAAVCGPLTGNWQSPRILATIDTGPSNPATGAVTKNNLLYVATDSATQNKPDLFIYDITNLSSPTLVSSLNTGPGAASLALADKYIFLGNQSINGQLEVVDVNNTSNPILVKTYKLPGAYTDGTTISNTLIYSRKKIYLGTAKSQIAEFHAIDVSNPLAPQEEGTFEINAGINALNAQGDKIFVASPAAEELKILDVSNPSSIRKIGGYDAPGGSGNGKSLFRVLNNLYLGRTIGGSELNLLNISNPASPTLTSSKEVNTSINDMDGNKDLLLLMTGDVNKKLQIWQNLTLTGFLNPSGTLTSLSCKNNLIFLTTSTPDGVLIIGPGL